MEQTISIIVPVYNVKNYVEKSVSSILAQTYPHLQLILVDDGSTDGSASICDAYAAKDPRIIVIHQPNGGVSKARNAGLERATGEWILFVDSDDYVDHDYCRRMLDAAQQCGADVAIARPTAEQLPETHKYNASEIGLLKRTCLAYDESQFGYNIDGPWGKLFRNSVIQKHIIRFPEILARSEDAYFCATVYEHTSNICCLNWFGYYHVEREGSLCHRFAPDAPEMLERILIENQKWVQRYHPDEPTYQAALWHRVLPGIDECERLYFLHDGNKNTVWKKAASYNQFIRGDIINHAIRKLKLKNVAKQQYRIRLVFYKLHLGWLFLLLKIYQS